MPKLRVLIARAGRDLFGGQLELHNFESTPPEWIAAHANSVLAYCASALWSISGDRIHLAESLRYTATCMTGMRKCLGMASDHPAFRLEELVYRIFRAEVVGKNHSSAFVHVKYLKQLLEKKAEVGALDNDSLLMVMHSDNNLAISRNSRPALESLWLHTVFSKSWGQADMLFPQDVTYHVDYSAPSIELQGILVELNKFFWQCSISQAHGALANEANWQSVVSRREWLTNRVLHQYMGLIEENDYTPGVGAPASSVDALLEQCLLLAACTALRFQKKVITVGGCILLSTWNALLHRTSSTFSELERTASEDWLRVHAHPVIWIVFVGALMENKLQALSPTMQHETPWLERLRSCSKPARLRSWPELSAILGRFPYTPQELPLPYDGWIDDVLVAA